LFAVIQRGAVPVDAFTRHISNDIVQILQALVILCVAAESAFRGPLRAIFRRAGPAESTAA
jgi:ABC-type uncharacterized transport system permease subunit